MEDIDLRDYFAAQCPTKFNPTWGDVKKELGLNPSLPIERWTPQMSLQYEAIERYKWADAMMEARKNDKG